MFPDCTYISRLSTWKLVAAEVQIRKPMKKNINSATYGLEKCHYKCIFFYFILTVIVCFSYWLAIAEFSCEQLCLYQSRQPVLSKAHTNVKEAPHNFFKPMPSSLIGASWLRNSLPYTTIPLLYPHVRVFMAAEAF